MNQIASQIAKNVQNMISSPRVRESTSLLEWLGYHEVDEAVACCAELMSEWTDEQGVFSYNVGTHAELYYFGYQIEVIGNLWMFECLVKGRANFSDYDLRNGLRIAKKLQEQNL